MRKFLVWAALCTLFAGCASKEKDAVSQAPPDPMEYSPITQVQGKVVAVEDALRYVVIDFAFAKLPQPGQQLALYRDEKKVGEVTVGKLPSHFRGQMVVADITAGFAANGDVARIESSGTP